MREARVDGMVDIALPASLGRFLMALDRWSLGGIFLRSTVAAPWSAVARRNRGMAIEIVWRLVWESTFGSGFFSVQKRTSIFPLRATWTFVRSSAASAGCCRSPSAPLQGL